MNRRLKTMLSEGLEHAGFLSLAESFLSRRGHVIFMLHRVLPRQEIEHCYNPALAITPESFEKFLEFAIQHREVVPLDELVQSALQQSGGQAKLCAFTFDDGWEDNFRIAAPILRKYNLPATIFLPTGFIGDSTLFPEERLWHICRRTKSTDRLEELYTVVKKEFPGVTLDRSRPDLDLCSRFKRLPYSRKGAITERLEQQFDVVAPRGRAAFMTWDQVRLLQAQGVTFGSHTVHHSLLSIEDADTIRQELTESRLTLAETLGCEVPYLAYPSGDYDRRVIEMTAQSGYRGAVSTLAGTVTPDSNPYLLSRLPIDNAVVNDHRSDFSKARTRLYMLSAGWRGRRT